MAWIDYIKAYDMVPHLWIIECLDLFGVAENIKSLFVNSMEKWKVMLCSGNSESGEIEIKPGTFQGDSLSSLWNGVWYRKVCFVSNGEKKYCEVSWYRVARW